LDKAGGVLASGIFDFSGILMPAIVGEMPQLAIK